MIITIPVSWKERRIPLVYVKDSNVCAYLLKCYGLSLSDHTNWFGNMYYATNFGESRDKPYSLGDELIMIFFDLMNNIFIRFYVLFMLVMLILFIDGIINLNPGRIIGLLAVALIMVFWSRICFWAYRRYVENIPESRGWKMIPLLSKEHIRIAESYVRNKEKFEEWLEHFRDRS
jgi:hypothetical protein